MIFALFSLGSYVSTVVGIAITYGPAIGLWDALAGTLIYTLLWKYQTGEWWFSKKKPYSFYIDNNGWKIEGRGSILETITLLAQDFMGILSKEKKEEMKK